MKQTYWPFLKKTNSAWRISQDFGIPERLRCRELTWDQSYCTRVCQLEIGDECTPGIATPGDNTCGNDSICTKIGATYTCQLSVDYSYKSSYFDSIHYLFLFVSLFFLFILFCFIFFIIN